MAIYRNPIQLQRAMSKKASEMRKNEIRTPSKVATFLQATAIKLAPRQTGKLIQGIKKSKGKGRGHYIVSSKVWGDFPYNMFVNQTAPFRTLRYKKANWRLGIKAGDKLVYGQSYPSHWNITGTPRFFHVATLRAMKNFKKIARINTRKALRAGV